jgi:hypothetical protein
MIASWVLAHEKTGWIAPAEAKKMKNPVKATKASIQKGGEIYEKKCSLCHGIKGDGKGPASAGLNPKPTNFKESHGEKMTDGGDASPYNPEGIGHSSGKSCVLRDPLFPLTTFLCLPLLYFFEHGLSSFSSESKRDLPRPR